MWFGRLPADHLFAGEGKDDPRPIHNALARDRLFRTIGPVVVRQAEVGRPSTEDLLHGDFPRMTRVA